MEREGDRHTYYLFPPKGENAAAGTLQREAQRRARTTPWKWHVFAV